MFQCHLVKTCYHFAGRRSKSDVETFARHNYSTRPELDGELVTAAGQTIADGCFVSSDANIAKLGKRGVVKGGRTGKVGYGE